jgi:hypothetical protein
VADTEPENETPISRIGDERRALRTDLRVAQIDVGDPGPHLDAAGRGAHELRGRMTSLFTSAAKIASNPASSASRAIVWISSALQPTPGMTPSASRSAMEALLFSYRFNSS